MKVWTEGVLKKKMRNEKRKSSFKIEESLEREQVKRKGIKMLMRKLGRLKKQKTKQDSREEQIPVISKLFNKQAMVACNHSKLL